MTDFFRSLSKRATAILIAFVILVLIAVPTALLSGLLSGVFESPAEGMRVFFIMVGAGVLFLIVELFIENGRERRKKKASSAQK
ncbi:MULTISPECIES: hypothetical protein [Glutamicibacter]|uniref:Uncharacterized protein n=2 Tax=Glutamicibacter arilaitensis TaxID=256701 RepID=A0A2N7S570_9MICC|nr:MULTISPECIES: hypothetical protein [Glutamicibacter]PMQ21274.1 hypothetical protein CIK84_06875 [Glutamicibacter arilaitensis]CBT75518.1 hypothetical protein AARI_13110 [Glutamicibacter arilaitensis Re117]HCH47406.1 hypothetical protein [Glutamicibacter sp.]HCJ53805.1 hypothetical protein [Glutamicibacter sp.]HCM93600.1 hypothetical protein [Glutamicibacter sp.]